MLGMLSLFPGLPTVPFLVPAIGLGILAYRMRALPPTPAADGPDAAAAPESVEEMAPIDPLQLEVGYALLGLVQPGDAGGELLERIRVLRRQFAQELGFLVPPVRIRDNVTLPASQYAFRIRGSEVARGEAHAERWLAMNPGDGDGDLPGLEVREPTFGLPARWIDVAHKDAAQASGHTVVDASTVVATHLSETIRRHGAALLRRQDVQNLLNRLKDTHPAIVDTLVPALLPLAVVHRVLQRLLGEGVSIRDLPVILEVLADMAPATKDPAVLAEHARAALAETVCAPYLGADATLRVLLLSPPAEAQLVEKLDDDGLPATLGQPLLEGIARAIERAPAFDTKPVLLCGSNLRRHVRALTERTLPHLAVLSFAELSAKAAVRAVGTVESLNAHQAL